MQQWAEGPQTAHCQGLGSAQLGSGAWRWSTIQIAVHALVHGSLPTSSHQPDAHDREDRLPDGMVRNGNVQKDSVLTFTRAGNGRVTAAANGTELTTGTDALAVLSRAVTESAQPVCV